MGWVDMVGLVVRTVMAMRRGLFVEETLTSVSPRVLCAWFDARRTTGVEGTNIIAFSSRRQAAPDSICYVQGFFDLETLTPLEGRIITANRETTLTAEMHRDTEAILIR